MITVKTLYASGNWQVTAGREDEFMQRWTEFLNWTRSAFPEFGQANLIRDEDDPQHFISFATWDSIDARREWKSSPEFAVRFEACRSLCDDMRGSNYKVVVSI